jgi:hypothetical protein
MHPIDRSKIWMKGEVGYNYSALTAFMDSASVENQIIAANGWSGSALADHNGYQLGLELGFLINPYMGFALGYRDVHSNDYTLNQNLGNGPATVTGGGGVTYSSDFENESLSPVADYFSADLYLFLPDASGRFFLSAGAALVRGQVHVEDDYSYVIANDDPTVADTFSGDLVSYGVGFQASIGRDIALGGPWGLSLYGRGRFARLTNFRGTVYNPNTGGVANDGLALFPNGEVFSTDVANIGGSGITYATVDFTGFDVGVALTFFTY